MFPSLPLAVRLAIFPNGPRVDASEVMVRNMLARDAQEGIGAFIEKRAPEWQDR